MTTPWTSSDGMRQRAEVSTNYDAMQTWELERRLQSARMGCDLWQRAEDPPWIVEIRDVLNTRHRQETLAHNWRILEREGFGL